MSRALMDQYSDQDFIAIILNSYSYAECLLNLGYHSNSGSSTRRLKEKIQELNIDISHFVTTTPIARTEDNIFVENSTANQTTVRRWYKQGGYTEYKCSICGQEPFWNGKELIMILDHINGKNHDDRLENLRWVCPNCNYQLDTTNGKNRTHKEHKVNTCIDCGKVISAQAIRCCSCEQATRRPEVVKNIDRETLKHLIRTMPFTKIGEMFQVSDNAVRKWCDKYHLPRKASVIKELSDDEWAKI